MFQKAANNFIKNVGHIHREQPKFFRMYLISYKNYSDFFHEFNQNYKILKHHFI